MSNPRNNYAHWQWTLRQAWSRMPWRQWNALWLLSVIAMLYGIFVYPLYWQRDALQDQLIAQASSKVSQRLKVPERLDQLAGFYEYFPAESQMVAVLAMLHDTAPQRNLSLPQGEYRLIVGQANGQVSSAAQRDLLMRYEIIFPVKGKYQDIRGFVADALKQQPGIALDSLIFTRESSARVGVDAELRFTLYVRAGL
jgi:hypothetical protein